MAKRGSGTSCTECKERPPTRRGLCNRCYHKHYQHAKRHGISFAELEDKGVFAKTAWGVADPPGDHPQAALKYLKEDK